MEKTRLAWLTQQYQQAHRHYHTLFHVVEMFDAAAKHGLVLSENQVLAIWYHDVVYDPQATDNEAKSAHHARLDLNTVLEKDAVDDVCAMILDTQKHQASSPESQVVLDLDLAILGAPAVRYQEYAQQIRAEYHFVADDVYRRVRAEVLSRFHRRAQEDTLFVHLPSSVSRQAAKNLHWEISNLSHT